MGSVTQLRKDNPLARRDEMAETAFKAIERKGRCYKGNPGNIDLTLRLSFEESASPSAPHDITKLFGQVCGKLGIFGELVGAVGRKGGERDSFSLTIESDRDTIDGLIRKTGRSQFHQDCQDLGLVNISSNAMTYSRPHVIAANDM